MSSLTFLKSARLAVLGLVALVTMLCPYGAGAASATEDLPTICAQTGGDAICVEIP